MPIHTTLLKRRVQSVLYIYFFSLLLSFTMAACAAVCNKHVLNIYKITLGDLQLKLKFRIPDKPNYSN